MYSQENPGAQGQQAPAGPGQWPAQGNPARRLTLGDALAVGGGLLVFAFSFLPFVSYDDDLSEALFLESRDLDTWFNAWEGETFMAPLTWFAIGAAFAVALLGVWRYFTGSRARFLTFTIPQLQVGLSLFATFVMLGYATASRSVLFGNDLAKASGNGNSMYYTDGLDLGAGGYLMLTFALVATIGSFLALYEAGPTLVGSRPGGYGGSGGYYQQQAAQARQDAAQAPDQPATTDSPKPDAPDEVPPSKS